ncbi:hypothetical protein Tco_0018805, partial [Tanacetum coccineum]
VMDAPTIPVSVDSYEGNFKDAPAAADAFPTMTIVAILASLGGLFEAFMSICKGCPTMEAIETVTRSQERRTHREVEQQLASIQKSQRQDRENFRKLQELTTTPEEAHAMHMDHYRSVDDNLLEGCKIKMTRDVNVES